VPKRRRPPSAPPDAAPPVRDPPSKEELRRFVAAAPGRVGKREAARAFGVKPEHKPALKAALKSLEADGTLQPAGARRFQEAGRLPESMIVQITGTDPDGDAIARPVGWKNPGPPPMILMAP
jgi:ribonuclease R